MEKQENKMQALVKIHIRRIEELLGIIYNESNEMLVKFRAHFLRKNIVLYSKGAYSSICPKSNRWDITPRVFTPTLNASIYHLRSEQEWARGSKTWIICSI